MDIPVLSHTLDKVRYFRNMLLSVGGPLVRIILLRGDHYAFGALHAAVSDVSDEPANPLCVLQPLNARASLPVKKVRPTPPTFVYFRCTRDAFVEALMDEYGEETCELVAFENDPTLATSSK